jgi:uncharacterized protein
VTARGRDGADVVVALAAGLRAAGVAVGTGQVVTCARAMAAVDLDDVIDRYWAGRVTLLGDHRDVPTYDRIFGAVVLGRDPLASGAAGDGDDGDDDVGASQVTGRDAASDAPSEAGAGSGELAAGGLASDRERLRHRRFDRATADELAAIGEAIRRLPLALPHRTTRRRVRGRGGEIDLPRTLDRALATDGELFERSWHRRRSHPRPLVLLLDVSGSMAGHARAMLRFAVAARGAAGPGPRGRVEVFAFGTRLTRLTDALSLRDPDAAIAAAAAEVVDWDGGTRIGDSLDRLVRTWGPRGTLRGAVVVVCSDGLERGDPDLLGVATARLRRHVHRVVWVNPLAGDPRYEPTQRGMRAALPHVDVLVPGHDLASLEALAEVLEDLR